VKKVVAEEPEEWREEWRWEGSRSCRNDRRRRWWSRADRWMFRKMFTLKLKWNETKMNAFYCVLTHKHKRFFYLVKKQIATWNFHDISHPINF